MRSTCSFSPWAARCRRRATASGRYRWSVPSPSACKRYALAWVQGQLDSVKYLRYRARKHLRSVLRTASFDQRALTLLIGGRELSVQALEQDAALFNGAFGLAGPGLLKWSGPIHTQTTEESEAFRDLLWAEAASSRYSRA